MLGEVSLADRIFPFCRRRRRGCACLPSGASAETDSRRIQGKVGLSALLEVEAWTKAYSKRENGLPAE